MESTISDEMGWCAAHCDMRSRHECSYFVLVFLMTLFTSVDDICMVNMTDLRWPWQMFLEYTRQGVRDPFFRLWASFLAGQLHASGGKGQKNMQAEQWMQTFTYVQYANSPYRSSFIPKLWPWFQKVSMIQLTHHFCCCFKAGTQHEQWLLSMFWKQGSQQQLETMRYIFGK